MQKTQRAVLASRPIIRRRRITAGEPLKKATFQIHASVVDAIKAAVQAGVAPSANALVEEAVKDKLRELRRARVYQAYAEAAQDPAFNEDVEDTTRAFEGTTADGLSDARR
ncbi:MAG: hypothetical protein ABR499_00825 [Gemmatimonadaceae bacterium]